MSSNHEDRLVRLAFGDLDTQEAAELSAQVGNLTGQIRTLEGRVGDVSSRLGALQSDLALRLIDRGVGLRHDGNAARLGDVDIPFGVRGDQV